MVHCNQQVEMSTHYGFEVVRSAEFLSKGLHIELKVPFHYAYAKQQAYRTVAISLPLNSRMTPTLQFWILCVRIWTNWMVHCNQQVEMPTHYGFEVVKSAEFLSKGLHIELKVPFHYAYAKQQAYRTVAISLPLNSRMTPTLQFWILCGLSTAGVLWGTG